MRPCGIFRVIILNNLASLQHLDQKKDNDFFSTAVLHHYYKTMSTASEEEKMCKKLPTSVTWRQVGEKKGCRTILALKAFNKRFL